MIDLGDCREQQHLRELEAEMTGRGWIRSADDLGDVIYLQSQGYWCVEIDNFGYWALRYFSGTSFRTETEGEDLKDLQEALAISGLSSTGQERK